MPPKQKGEEDKEALTAWGKEVGGLQAGLGYHPGQKRAYRHGETVKLVVRVRNVGKEEVKFQYLRQFFIETPPAVTDGEGKPLHRVAVTAFGFHIPVEVSLAPGKEAELYELKLELKPAREGGNEVRFNALHGTGKFQIQYERVLGNSSSGSIKLDPALSMLGTGKLELEIKSAPPGATGEGAPEKKDREEANKNPIKIRVYIEKVNVDMATITASCMLIGSIDEVTKPVRFENLRVAEKAKITDRGKEVQLTDLQLLPRDTHFYLFLKAYEEEFGFEVIGIETLRLCGRPHNPGYVA